MSAAKIFDPPTPPLTNSNPSSSCPSPIPHCPSPGPRFVSLRNKVLKRCESGNPFYSLEFFPPRTANGAINLLGRMERMAQGSPLFCDITWHPAGHPDSTEPTSSLTFAAAMVNHLGLNTMLHMTCCNRTKEKLDQSLFRAKELGISNLLLLRGDPPKGEDWTPTDGGFNYATDFVRHVRDNFPDTFTVAVAGYPAGHPDCTSYEDDLHHLKVKVDAGADFIITQLFFELETFENFVRDCRKIGITCPIVPGILPIQGYESLRHITKLGGLKVPQNILDVVEPIKDDDAAIRAFGIEYTSRMCKEILRKELAPGLHLYTLNREVASIAILKNVGLWALDPHKSLPWKPTTNHSRFQEDVRPIFWSSRPHSYVARTSDWEEFPNGRWGNSSAATFGDITDHHIFYLRSRSSRQERLDMWGRALNGEEDVWAVFSKFLNCEPSEFGIPATRRSDKVSCIPWNEEKLAAETQLISDDLLRLNRRGVLTINSQPRCNGVSSNHPDLGWGKPGGYVYQKAYLEFFVSPSRAHALKQIIGKYEPRVNYHIINYNGEDDFTNCDQLEPIAVTWGVFPGKEIVQPTVVDPISFKFWKDEAFSLWHSHWGMLYPEGSTSRKVIDYIVQNYYLVNLVDNEFPEESILWQVCEEMISAADGRPKDVSSPAKSANQLQVSIPAQDPRSAGSVSPNTRRSDSGVDYDNWPVKMTRTIYDRVL